MARPLMVLALNFPTSIAPSEMVRARISSGAAKHLLRVTHRPLRTEYNVGQQGITPEQMTIHSGTST